MPKRSRKPKLPDPNVTAFSIIQAIAGETPPSPPDDGKDPAAVALGRKGGLKGGPARAKKLGKKKLSELGKKMATARWAKKRER
jgi:hypothetical protein